MSAERWRPSSDVASARRRARMLAQARSFFADREVLEVDTPLLSSTTVSDPHIESVQVALAHRPGKPYFLQTSPEYFMKRLLCSGYPDIYQVCKVFREGEAGRRHSPEFTMVEWYRHGFNLARIMEETADFISALVEPQHLSAPTEIIDYRSAFRELAGIDPPEASLAALAESAGADDTLIESLGDDRDAWLDLVLSLRVVPHFGAGRLTVLYHYPASQAALARRCPDDDSVADRFEIFFGDLELANGFVELQDAKEQARRFAADRWLRASRNQTVHPPDERLLAALASGLPQCAGVAVGFERLLMINEMTDDIRKAQSFPFDEEDE
ncbi:MAG TPA: EF-P lysine aminoacylase EpmA [Woeseiaceae bacterium]|nr:EF-P lysine aminoacylase EpmA [Woeseiaceae bacterium]